MSNHWHLVLWPKKDGDLSRFTGWLTLTHTQRWHAHRGSAGSGHVYQGRFKSFPVQDNEHLLTVCRYVERNALRAGLVRRAEDWRWGSLWRWQAGDAASKRLLSAWPVPRLPKWLDHVSRPQSKADLQPLRQSVQRGRWAKRAGARIRLEYWAWKPRSARAGGRRRRKKVPDTVSAPAKYGLL